MLLLVTWMVQARPTPRSFADPSIEPPAFRFSCQPIDAAAFSTHSRIPQVEMRQPWTVVSPGSVKFRMRRSIGSIPRPSAAVSR